jgi:hypothetical protein
MRSADQAFWRRLQAQALAVGLVVTDGWTVSGAVSVKGDATRTSGTFLGCVDRVGRINLQRTFWVNMDMPGFHLLVSLRERSQATMRAGVHGLLALREKQLF